MPILSEAENEHSGPIVKACPYVQKFLAIMAALASAMQGMCGALPGVYTSRGERHRSDATLEQASQPVKVYTCESHEGTQLGLI